jgi:hypothetical protein
MTRERDGFIHGWPTTRRFPRTEREAFRDYGIAIVCYGERYPWRKRLAVVCAVIFSYLLLR